MVVPLLNLNTWQLNLLDDTNWNIRPLMPCPWPLIRQTWPQLETTMDMTSYFLVNWKVSVMLAMCCSALSTSGNSKNVVLAFETARQKQITTVALIGSKEGVAKNSWFWCFRFRQRPLHIFRNCTSQSDISYVIWLRKHCTLLQQNKNLAPNLCNSILRHFGQKFMPWAIVPK